MIGCPGMTLNYPAAQSRDYAAVLPDESGQHWVWCSPKLPGCAHNHTSATEPPVGSLGTKFLIYR